MSVFNEHIIALAKSNLAWIKHNPDAMLSLIERHQNKEYSNQFTVDLDASLYQNEAQGGGWFRKDEKQHRDTFHSSNPLDKIKHIQNLGKSQPRIKQLGLRIIGRNYFNSLPDDLKTHYTTYLTSIFHNISTTADFSDRLRVDPNILLKETKEEFKKPNLSDKDRKILSQLENLISTKIKKQQDLGF
tara:strand:- start:77 stop:637 length:561 start_codon:yes stop_codon:yes gene_type:complete